MPHLGSVGPRKSGRKTLPLQGLFFIIVFVIGLYAVMNSSLFNLAEVKVTGNNQMKPQEVIDLAGITIGTNVFKMKTADMQAKIELNPLVKEAIVERLWPNGIQVSVTERVGVGLIPHKGNFLVIDEESYYIYREAALVKTTLPIITGVELGNIRVGEMISSEPLQDALYYLSVMSPEISTVLSEINCADQENIVLYTLDGVEVRLGSKEKAREKLACYLDVISQTYDEKIQYIDLRYESKPVVKFLQPSK